MVHWWTVGLLLIVGGVFFGGRPCNGAGDFGLPYSVPGFEASFRSGIGSGIVAVVKANASLLKYEANLDRSGATTVLYDVATNLTSPLNKVMGHVAAAFGANGTESMKMLADELQGTIEPTKVALEEASSKIRTLEGAVRPNAFNTLATNVSTIEAEIESLAASWPSFVAAVAMASADDSTYGASNISSLITPAIVQSLTAPILAINSALTDIASMYGTIGKDRINAIGIETNTNTSIQNSVQDLAGSVTIANRTFTDAARQIEQQCNNTVRQVRDVYNQLLGRLAEDTSVVKVKRFLEQLEAQGLEQNRRTGELLRDLASHYRQSIQSAGDAIGERLFGATAALIDEATASDNGNADRCLQRYIGDFRQGTYAATRLSVCYQVDARTVGYFSTANTAFLEQLRNGAVYGNQAQSVCAQGSAGCVAEYLDQLEGISMQNQARMNAFATFLGEEMVGLRDRYDVCTRAVRADVEHLVQATNEKFQKCLVTGR
uniref:Protein TsetseEP domain-containing protein n=1 Tax=Anopheles epiroticus TaxID=199890 RepID=A0A182PPK8_9DIPT